MKNHQEPHCWMVVSSKGRYSSRAEAIERAQRDGLWVVRCDDLQDIADDLERAT